MRILFTGGGTLGPVAPLLAVAEELADGNKLFWIGTARGPEAALVAKAGIPFRAIAAAKFRRYFSLWTLLDPLLFLIGLLEAIGVLITLMPDVIVGAGGYVSVPVVIAGKLLGIPSLIHQQDVLPGLANKIMAPFARAVTVAVPESAAAFDVRKTTVVGNPVRRAIEDVALHHDERRHDALRHFGFLGSKPIVLVTGGGSGASALNAAVDAMLDELLAVADVLHLTGLGKRGSHGIGYVSREVATDEMPLAYAAADVVVCRAGMSTISELLVLGIPSVVTPMPHTHQEANAEFLVQHGNAVVVGQDEPDFPRRLLHAIRHTLDASRTNHTTRATSASTFGAPARRVLAERILAFKTISPLG